MSEIRAFLEGHLLSIIEADLEAYHATTVPELTLYEWHVTPHRIDGIPFHDFMMEETRSEDSAASALEPNPSREREPGDKPRVRFDLANYVEQRYGDTVICSYTMLISKATTSGVEVLSYNESRVLVIFEGEWRVVHVHKSPAWPAPFQPPSSHQT
jgi:hypothetical protein